MVAAGPGAVRKVLSGTCRAVADLPFANAATDKERQVPVLEMGRASKLIWRNE